MTRLTFLLAASIVALPAQAQKQEAAASLIAAQADLLNTIHAQGMKAGDSFFIRTNEDWQQGNCTIPARTLITGEVAAVTLQPHHVEWALKFAKVPCRGSAVAYRQPLLIALQAVHIAHSSALSRLSTAGFEDQTIASLFSPARPGQAVASVSGSGVAPGTNYSGFEPETSLVTGEVRGLRGTSMRLPVSGTATTLVSTKADIYVDRSATFVLMLPPARDVMAPDAVAAAPAPAKTAIAATPVPRTAEPSELCNAATCSFLSAAPSVTSSAAATWTVPLASLGFQPRPGQLLSGLERSASILPLGDKELLLTFDTHALHRRESTFGRDWKPRNVRGVVLSRIDGHVLLVRDWAVSDDLDMPVWSMGNGNVLAHVGRNLVEYGPDLTEIHRVSLSGPVVFLSASAAGQTMLLATVHEKHSAAEHEKLSAFLEANQRIDEDYDLTGLGQDLNIVGTRQIAVEPLRPALLPGGIVEFKLLKGDLWQLVSTSWGGLPVELARLHSGCRPEVTALAAGLLNIRGCAHDRAVEGWYSVLDAHGKLILKGKTAYGDLLQQTATSHDGRLFAVAMSNFDHEVHRGEKLTEGDYKKLTLTVYANPSGRAVFSTHLPTGSAQEHTFCLTPQGDALVVLTGDSLQSLSLPQDKVSAASN